MPFQITGLDAAPFRCFYGLSDDELQSFRVKRFIADAYIHAHYAKRGCYAARIDRA